MEKRMLIDGMKCMHCKASVEKRLPPYRGYLLLKSIWRKRQRLSGWIPKWKIRR